MKNINGPLKVGIGGPVGAGKTSLTAELCKFLSKKISMAVISNDIYTKEDAEFLMKVQALPLERIKGVETGGCPHTAIREDASINMLAVENMKKKFPDLDLILIESGGDNLAATFSPELVDLSIYVIDVGMGGDIPRKGGPAIQKSDLLIINKTDLAPHVDVNLDTMKEDVKKARNGLPYVFCQMKKQIGVEDIAKFLDLNGKPVQHVPNNNDKRLSYELALFQARKLSWLANTRKIFLFSSNNVVPYDRNEKYNIMQLEWRQESQLLAASGVVFYNFLKTQQTNGSAWQKYICNLSGGTDAKYDITGLEDVIIKMTLLGMKKNINRTNKNGDDEQKEGN